LQATLCRWTQYGLQGFAAQVTCAVDSFKELLTAQVSKDHHLVAEPRCCRASGELSFSMDDWRHQLGKIVSEPVGAVSEVVLHEGTPYSSHTSPLNRLRV